MEKLEKTTSNLAFINNCYELGFLDDSLDGYFIRILYSFSEIVKSLSLAEEVRVHQNLICSILGKPTNKRVQAHTKMLENCIQKLCSLNRKMGSEDGSGSGANRIPVDIRFGVCLDLMRLHFSDMKEQLELFESFVRERPQKTFLDQYNKLVQRAITPKAK